MINEESPSLGEYDILQLLSDTGIGKRSIDSETLRIAMSKLPSPAQMQRGAITRELFKYAVVLTDMDACFPPIYEDAETATIRSCIKARQETLYAALGIKGAPF